MLAVISDIHSNLEALQAVLDDIESTGAKRIICLGDVVGYGPNPSECISLVRQYCSVCLQGNHDYAVLHEPLGFGESARKSILWTQKMIKPGLFRNRGMGSAWDFLKGLPTSHKESGMLFVHGSPRDHMMEYIEENDLFDMGFGPGEKITNILAGLNGLCFNGHTHKAGIITSDCKFLKPKDLDDEGWSYENGPAIVNVGSVGQPRDGDQHASYVLVDGRRILYHRVSYNVTLTKMKIFSIRGLDDMLGERLLEGR